MACQQLMVLSQHTSVLSPGAGPVLGSSSAYFSERYKLGVEEGRPEGRQPGRPSRRRCETTGGEAGPTGDCLVFVLTGPDRAYDVDGAYRRL